MSNVDRYMKKAFDAIEKVKIPKKSDDTEQMRFKQSNGSVPKVYKGYISSLGASIIQAGIKSAIYFYEAKEGGGEGDRRLITAAIRYILYPEKETSEIYNYLLSDKLSAEPHELQKQALQIMDAATALKLALRTYTME